MDTSNSVESIVAKIVTIKDIELHTLARRKIPVARQFYVEFSVGDTLRSMAIAKESKNHTSWDTKFYFDGDDHSVIRVKVYQKHHIGKDKLVASLTDTIGGALRKLKDGVLERTLGKDTSDESDSGMTLKFALSAESRGNSNAEERQVIDVVAGASEAINPLNSTPAAAGFLSSAVDAGTNITTGTQTFETTWNVLLQRMELFNKIVTGIAQIHPYTSLAWSVISAANQVLVNQKNRDDKIIHLAGTMSDVFTFVEDAEPLKAIKAHLKTITLLIQQVTECGYFITEYAKQKNFWVRTAKYTISDIDTRITDYKNKFRELKSAFLEGVAVQTGIAVVRLMNLVEPIAESIDLNDMPYAPGARYAQEKGCLPGTRESFLREICDILNNLNQDAPQVCLLTGVAGSGKCTMAHAIARLYDGQRRLGSSYCFASTDVARRNPQNLFSTIVRGLADHDPQFKAALWEVVKGDRALRMSQSPFEQVEKLIVEPSQNLDTIGPLVIVIDALDESGNQASRRQLLRAISKQIAENAFPSNLRFLITARPETDILTALPPRPQIVHKQMSDIPQDVVDRDIEKFVYHSLCQYTELESSWPDREWCRLLVHHSQHLFQWASTACNFIEGDGTVGLDPSERLDSLVNTDGGCSLDSLYQTILSQLFTLDNTRERFRTVMAIVLALNEPLSLTSVSALLGKDLNIRAIIKPMGSLLDGVLDEEKPIRPLHTSFRDFLLDPARSSVFHVDIQPQHSLRLGRALLACMQNLLHFNICDLKDARVRNTAVPDLLNKVNKTIPPHLAYSCQYWMYHLQDVDCTPDLLNDMTLFFKSFLPYWLEAISLLSLSSPLSSILSALETCASLKKWAKDQEIATLASETFQFIQVFAPVLRESTPHLYLSAMPQTPSSSPLCGLWFDHLQKHVSATLGLPTNWPAEVHILQETESIVSVAYSSDGTHIASCGRDLTIRVWNATTGQSVGGPFQGLMSPVTSVAYSPDGAQIVSGHWNKTIMVWNAVTGQPVSDPFEGHIDVVTSVVCSSDGIHIASGSNDKTIRVWNATTGQCVAGPFQGHEDSVTSVAYSSDGNYVVSGSKDKTIRVWNATTGHCMAEFKGHEDFVTSVACSPDGNCIVSGSKDQTIRVWNVTTGQSVGGPFQGHTSVVTSVAYSPDGIHIVSGSWNNSARIWNVTTGQCVAGPFLGHTESVTTVAYSPDGSHIISGSWDYTIRVWNATIGQSMVGLSGEYPGTVAYSPDGTHIASGFTEAITWVWDATTGQSVAGPFEGHVNSIDYSPDGTCIVSGSGDGTISVWNVTAGQCVADPFQGHTNVVISVAYSPDGTHIVSGSFDKTIRIWHAATGQCVVGPFQGHADQITSVAYSPDGTCIASGSDDKTIRIWSATTGQCVAGPFEGHEEYITSVAYLSDGVCVVSGSQDHSIRVWDATTGQLVVSPMEGHTSGVWTIACSPDSIHIVSGSVDSTIRIWNVTTGQCVAGPFQGHTDIVKTIAYSPDGDYIVSGSWDGAIKVWKVQEFTSFGDLCVDNSWIQSSNGACFGWIAPWNWNSFQLPIHSLVIAPNRTHQVDVDISLFGESWTSCWN